MAKRKKLPATLSDQLRERIRRWTERHDSSLYELAAEAGVDRSVVCRFIAGDRNINLATADRLAAVLRVRLADDP
jgi:transcriptional regulator with XRE-family HTH domain